MIDNNRWSELSENLEGLQKKIKSKINEDLVDDKHKEAFLRLTINLLGELEGLGEDVAEKLIIAGYKDAVFSHKGSFTNVDWNELDYEYS